MSRAIRTLAVLGTALALGAAGCGDGGDSSISVQAQDDLTFDPEEVEVAAGEVTVEMTCGEAIEHTFLVEEAGDQLVASCDPGETDTGTIELEPGEYTFYCDVGNHREAGMEGALTVEG